MKNSADLGGCYPPRPKASVDNTLLYLQNSSYPTQPHSIIANYLTEHNVALVSTSTFTLCLLVFIQITHMFVTFTLHT